MLKGPSLRFTPSIPLPACCPGDGGEEGEFDLECGASDADRERHRVLLYRVRQVLLHVAGALDLPANPLDDIIERLGGAAKVAEMTGRKSSVVGAESRAQRRAGLAVLVCVCACATRRDAWRPAAAGNPSKSALALSCPVLQPAIPACCDCPPAAGAQRRWQVGLRAAAHRHQPQGVLPSRPPAPAAGRLLLSPLHCP